LQCSNFRVNDYMLILRNDCVISFHFEIFAFSVMF
jgi:hypothetical protein